MSDQPEIVINRADIGGELAQQAGNYMWAAQRAVEAEAIYDTKKFNLDQLAAELDKQIRMKAEADGKKITETLIVKEVEKHPMFKSAKVELIKAKANMNMMKASREAWYQRKDALVQLAIKERGDIESIMSDRVLAR